MTDPFYRLFTSESVTEGHPDKICDAISDTILDDMLAQDPLSRVAVETMVTTGQVHVVGEVTTKAYSNIAKLVRDKLVEIGFISSPGKRTSPVQATRASCSVTPPTRPRNSCRFRSPPLTAFRAA